MGGTLRTRAWPHRGTFSKWLVLSLFLSWPYCGTIALAEAPRELSDSKSDSKSLPAQWYLLPEDDLVVFEAFEFAIMRINQMRSVCGRGYNLAPLRKSSYTCSEAYMKTHSLFTEFLLHIEPLYGLAPREIKVSVARQNSGEEDMSLFQVVDVDPLPCALYSQMDDAELMVSVTSTSVQAARSAAMKKINGQRQILCPQRPQLQLQRVISATEQPAEGKVLRLVLEMREASTSFSANSFTDVIAVNYALDQEVPGQQTISPEIYPARSPCEMYYSSQEESAVRENKTRRLDAVSKDWGPIADGARNRSAARNSTSARRLSGPAGLVEEFKDKGLQIPDDFDPRLERTICFPRGISRRQGSCGASWAFAATAVASFRECLWYLKSGDPSAGLNFFSAQELVSCRPMEACSGGDASIAFYYMKYTGVARETCSPYRMRCFLDNSVISVQSADFETTTPKKANFRETGDTCPAAPDENSAPCRCLPSVYHLSMPVLCNMLPNACENVTVPHYFHIAGTAEGNTVPEMERHMKQELLDSGPLYVSLLIYEDVYDPVSWTESGIYMHRHGDLIGKHAVTCIGWGTDSESRDYWLLLNSAGSGWQQQGYFKVSRGETPLQMMKFGTWGVDMSHPEIDRSAPDIRDVEVTYSAEMSAVPGLLGVQKVASIWLEVSSITNEAARLLVRVQGLASTVTGESRSEDFLMKHVHKINLMKLGLLGERAKIQIWAVDHAQNDGTWGPFTFSIPSKAQFEKAQTGRRLKVTRSTEADVFV